MTTEAGSGKSIHEWLIILPDQHGAGEKRAAVRPEHLQNMPPRVKAGMYTLGGATLAATGGEAIMNGSVLIAQAEKLDDILDDLKRDVYTTQGVWEWDRVQILPFKTALRVPM